MIPTMQFMARGDQDVTVRPDTDAEVFVIVGSWLKGSSGNAATLVLTDGTDSDTLESTTGTLRSNVPIVATRDRYVTIHSAAANDFALASVARVQVKSHL